MGSRIEVVVFTAAAALGLGVASRSLSGQARNLEYQDTIPRLRSRITHLLLDALSTEKFSLTISSALSLGDLPRMDRPTAGISSTRIFGETPNTALRVRRSLVWLLSFRDCFMQTMHLCSRLQLSGLSSNEICWQ